MKIKIYLFCAFLLARTSVHAQSTPTELGERVGLQNDLNNFVQGEGTRVFTGGSVPSFNLKEETVGSRYLFDRWVNGQVTNLRDSVMKLPTVLYNYDKVTQSLLMFQDKKIVIEIYRDQIKSFALKYKEKDYEFIRIPMISDEFFQPIIKNKKYSLYKTIRTRFVKADYSSNGISESGNNYDEYKDQPSFYVVFSNGRDFVKLEPRKKLIKQALPKDAAKIEAYFYTNNPEAIDEAFLTGLIENLNE
jgi:hypothetical protein